MLASYTNLLMYIVIIAKLAPLLLMSHSILVETEGLIETEGLL